MFPRIGQAASDSADGKAEGDAQVLHENESARVENRGSQGGGNRVIMLGPSAKPANFVRQIPNKPSRYSTWLTWWPAATAFPAGEPGHRSHQRSGTSIPSPKGYLLGDGKYHRVEAMPFVDGVFIPDGRIGPVQLDSAGHTFADFPRPTMRTAGYVWAGGAIPTGRL